MYLAFYIAGKMKMFDQKGVSSVLLFITILFINELFYCVCSTRIKAFYLHSQLLEHY